MSATRLPDVLLATHPRVYRNPWTGEAAWSCIQTLLACPGLSVLTVTP